MAESTVDLTSSVRNILPVANGGTGTATPGDTAGSGISITGAWPNQTIAATGGTGATGPAGPAGLGLDADSPDEPAMIPGAQGPQGNIGATGPAGPMGLGVDGIDGEDGLGIPGPAGTGTSGASLLGLVAPSSLSVPSLGSFTWGNQGDATATANAGGGLWFEASGVQQDIRFLYVAASGSFTAICGYMDGNVPPLVALRESSSGKLIGADASNGAGANVLGIFKYNSYTSFNANYISNSSTPASIFKFWKITSNGTVYTWYWSVDGQSWEQYLQKNVNDFFTTAADQIGMAINPNNASIRTGLLWVYWSLA